jgi:hypothetical protein
MGKIKNADDYILRFKGDGDVRVTATHFECSCGVRFERNSKDSLGRVQGLKMIKVHVRTAHLEALCEKCGRWIPFPNLNRHLSSKHPHDRSEEAGVPAPSAVAEPSVAPPVPPSDEPGEPLAAWQAVAEDKPVATELAAEVIRLLRWVNEKLGA